jgi:hypothetical protein
VIGNDLLDLIRLGGQRDGKTMDAAEDDADLHIESQSSLFEWVTC